MLKKVATKDLRVGMFVADVGRSWLNHPWKTKTKLLASADDIKRLVEFGIEEVTIDTDKSDKTALASPEEKKSPIAAATSSSQAPPKAAAAPRFPEVVSELEARLPQAAKTYTKALDTSKALLAACRMNQKIEVEAVKESVAEMVDNISQNQDALAALIKLRRFDDYSYTHSLNVSVLAISAGKSMGLSDKELHTLGMGTMFHDLGKTRIPGHILNKPGKLTDEEFAIMRSHADLSGKIILEQKMQVDELVYKVARHHHERHDGSGYPDGLAGDKIPFLVSLCGLSDIYDALTSDRVYHKGRAPHDSLKFIYSLRDTHFPAESVDRFIQSVGIYPPGTIVMLENKQTGVVMETSAGNLASPFVKIVGDASGSLFSNPKIIDLATNENKDYKISRVIPRSEAGFDPAFYFNLPK